MDAEGGGRAGNSLTCQLHIREYAAGCQKPAADPESEARLLNGSRNCWQMIDWIIYTLQLAQTKCEKIKVRSAC